MKKYLIEWSIYFAACLLYLGWRQRERMLRTFEALDTEYAEYVQRERAIEAVLRSIKRLPETRRRNA